LETRSIIVWNLNALIDFCACLELTEAGPRQGGLADKSPVGPGQEAEYMRYIPLSLHAAAGLGNEVPQNPENIF